MIATRGYSPVWHLARTIWLGADLSERWFVMLSDFGCYYDASGTEGDPSRPLVVVGLASTAKKWVKFDRDWERVLAEFGVPYLHMTNLVRFEDPFSGWNEIKRDAFLARLIPLLKRGVHKAFITKITPADFLAVARKFDLDRIGNPYPVAAGACVGMADRWIHENYPGRPIRHVLEAGDNNQKLFDMLIRLEGITPVIEPKIDPNTGKWFLPFQGDDLMAYEYRQVFREDKTYTPTLSMQTILRTIPQESYSHTQDTLIAMCQAHPDVFPPKQ